MLAKYTWIWLLVGLVACSSDSTDNNGSEAGGSNAPENTETYKIEGVITGAPNQLIKLQNLPIAQAGQKPQTIILDSARTNASGQFLMEGSTPYKQIAVLVVDNSHTISMVLDNTDYTIKGDFSNWEAATVIGSSETNILNNFLTTLEEKITTFRNARQQNMEQKTEASRESEYDAIDQLYGYLRQFIDTTSSGVTALYASDMVDASMDYEFLKSVYAHYKENMPGSPYLDRLQQKLSAQEQLMNQPATDISLPNPEGVTMSLSDLRGKYVLLDFWAAWCGPCRRENPNLVRVYNEYKNQGFTVFSVSLDQTKQAWVQAIEKDGLTWPYHVSELKKWQSAVLKDYGVNSIPATFLINPEGNIIGKNLRGYSLEYMLEQIFD